MSDLEKRVDALERLVRHLEVQLVTLLNKAYGQRPVVLTGGYGRRGIEFERGVPVAGNGAEVKKALDELRAEFTEKDIAVIDEALKERGIDVELVLDPSLPEDVTVVQRDVIPDLAGNGTAAKWIKRIGDPERYIREIRGDEHE